MANRGDMGWDIWKQWYIVMIQGETQWDVGIWEIGLWVWKKFREIRMERLGLGMRWEDRIIGNWKWEIDLWPQVSQ